MTRNQIVQCSSLVALVAMASAPAMVACGAASGDAAGAAAPSASAAPGVPQAGYPQQPGYPQAGAPGAPAGYPQQGAAPAGYPQQPTAPAGYPQQPAPGGYAQTQPGATPPGATPPGATPAGAPSATPAPLGAVNLTDPNALAALFQQAVSALPAQLSAPGAIPGDPVELGLKAAAAKYAAGEQPEGSIAKAQIQQGGQHFSFTYTLNAGTCYTIVGYSPPGQVQDLDLYLLAPPFYNPAIPGGIAGQDTTHNNTPTVGAAPHPLCPVIPGLAYKVDISARQGSGNIGVQIFSKPKS
jgi:hypothetical protein